MLEVLVSKERYAQIQLLIECIHNTSVLQMLGDRFNGRISRSITNHIKRINKCYGKRTLREISSAIFITHDFKWPSPSEVPVEVISSLHMAYDAYWF